MVKKRPIPQTSFRASPAIAKVKILPPDSTFFKILPGKGRKPDQTDNKVAPGMEVSYIAAWRQWFKFGAEKMSRFFASRNGWMIFLKDYHFSSGT